MSDGNPEPFAKWLTYLGMHLGNFMFFFIVLLCHFLQCFAFRI